MHVPAWNIVALLFFSATAVHAHFDHDDHRQLHARYANFDDRVNRAIRNLQKRIISIESELASLRSGGSLPSSSAAASSTGVLLSTSLPVATSSSTVSPTGNTMIIDTTTDPIATATATTAPSATETTTTDPMVTDIATSDAMSSPTMSTGTGTASSSTPTATGTVGKGNNIKKGLGYKTANFTYGFGEKVGWAYNWADYQDGGTLLPTTTFIPQSWGVPSDAANWTANAHAAIEAGATFILGFNEPDLAAQSNMTPAQAVEAWNTYMEPIKVAYPDVLLISPAITNGGDPMGVAWQKNFVASCTGCHIDGIAAHWYDMATNLGYFTGYFTDMATTFGLPLYITEFMGSGTVEEQTTFINTVVPWLEQQSFVARYAAFGDFNGTFVDEYGTLTPLGIAYRDAM